MRDAADNALMLPILREIRIELRERRSMLALLGSTSRHLARRSDDIERRFDELKVFLDSHFDELRTDLEIMLKTESMSRA